MALSQNARAVRARGAARLSRLAPLGLAGVVALMFVALRQPADVTSSTPLEQVTQVSSPKLPELLELPAPQPYLVVGSTRPDPSKLAASIDEMPAVLRFLAGDEVLKSSVADIEPRLPQYCDTVMRAAAEGEGISVDVILQAHVGAEGVRPGVPESQARIRALFDREHYDVIAIEGADLDPMTFEASVQDTALAQNLSPDYLRPLMLADAPNQAQLAYSYLHPQQYFFGCEDLPLNTLNGILLRRLEQVAPGAPTPQVGVIVGSLRSELGLAKLVLKMRARRAHTGALVIGNFHEESVRVSAEWLGVTVRFFDTVEGTVQRS